MIILVKTSETHLPLPKLLEKLKKLLQLKEKSLLKTQVFIRDYMTTVFYCP